MKTGIEIILGIWIVGCASLRPFPPEKLEQLTRAIDRNDAEVFQAELPNYRYSDLYYFDQVNLTELLKRAAKRGERCNPKIVDPLIDLGTYIPAFSIKENISQYILCPRVVETTYVRGEASDQKNIAVLTQNVLAEKINQVTSHKFTLADLDQVLVIARIYHSILKTMEGECLNGLKESCELSRKFTKTLADIKTLAENFRGSKKSYARDIASALENSTDPELGLPYQKSHR